MMRDNKFLSELMAREAQTIFHGKIRDGQHGAFTNENYSVKEVENPRLGYLDPLPEIDYSDDSYRLSINQSSSIETYFHLHAWEQPSLLAHFTDSLKHGMTVMDAGCGGGALLDLVKAETGAESIAVEPFVGYHRSLSDRGHTVFSSLEDVSPSFQQKIDFAISSHVIEHVPDPVMYLSQIRKMMKVGGALFLLTPNLDDVLIKLDPDRFAPFFFRKVHNYYFTAESLRWVAESAGWAVEKEVFHHPFSLSNCLRWLRDGKPAGRLKIDGIGGSIDKDWANYLRETRQSKDVGLVLRSLDAGQL